MKIRSLIVACGILSLMSFFLTTCKDSIQNEVNGDIQISNDENFIPENQAWNRLLNTVRTYSNERIGLIDFQNKKVEKLYPVYGAGDKLASFYIANFRDSGFVILSADKRAPEILAFSENGNFYYDINRKISKQTEEDETVIITDGIVHLSMIQARITFQKDNM